MANLNNFIRAAAMELPSTGDAASAAKLRAAIDVRLVAALSYVARPVLAELGDVAPEISFHTELTGTVASRAGLSPEAIDAFRFVMFRWTLRDGTNVGLKYGFTYSRSLPTLRLI